VRPAVRDLAIVLGVSWIVRAAFVAAIGDTHSLDVEYWRGALGAREEGTNPYETGVLNWPPLWLEVIVAINAIANRVDASFLSLLRVYLVAVESAIVVTLYFTLVSVGARRRTIRRALLVGFALNPVMVILVCQHGNSDVNVGLLATLACTALIAYRRSRDVVLWLVGCLFLGLGVLAKTTPLVLAPVLAPGAREASRVGRALGATLVILPVIAGLGVIAALVPRATYENVIQYRPRPGNFGFSGSFQAVSTTTNRYQAGAVGALCLAALAIWLWPRLQRLPPSATRRNMLVLTLAMAAALAFAEVLERLSVDVRSHYADAFTLALLALVVWLGYRLWSEPPLDAATLFTLVAVVFMTVVAFGTGYGAHYAPWFLPSLVATYVLLDDSWRQLLLVGYVIAAVTYVVEYAFVPFLGAFAGPVFGDPAWATDIGEWLQQPQNWGIVRIPLFAVYVAVIAAGAARVGALMRRSSADSVARTSPPAT
jgi:hypothetical protein